MKESINRVNISVLTDNNDSSLAKVMDKAGREYT